jgi:hypothetical protein
MHLHDFDDGLIYRRQFAIGPREFQFVPGCVASKIGTRLILTAHPDLLTQQVVDGDRSLTLLGYILDPHSPTPMIPPF